jgi:hypothetical protein
MDAEVEDGMALREVSFEVNAIIGGGQSLR